MDTKVKMSVYRCPNCGGEISFDAHSQNLTCPYCDTSFAIDTIKQYNQQINQQSTDNMDWKVEENHQKFEDENLLVYSCENCGGQIIGDLETIATHCPYCNSPVVMNKNIHGELKPDFLIPFQLDKNDAKIRLQEFYKNKPFLPKSFKEDQILDEVKGIYIPFWIYHCIADIHQQYRAKKVRHYSDAHYNYTEVRHYLVTREGTIDFSNVPVDGSSKIDNDAMQSIEPFDFSKAIPFNKDYLAGYFADKYDIGVKECESEANLRIRNSSDHFMQSTVSQYTSVQKEKSNIELKNKHFDYYLLPVWILNVNWNNEKYTLMMNGQTGKLIGNLPADMKLFWKDVLIYSVVFFVIVFILLSLLS